MIAKYTILTTPIISQAFQILSRVFVMLFGWRFPKTIPDLDKGVLIGAPHTSNWDFFVMLAAILTWRMDIRWIGKHTLFTGPLGPIMKWLGGIPIDRTNTQNFVEQIVELFNENEKLLIVIAPEGTRKPVERWRTGFYHMAYNAKVPIILSYIDYKHKEVGIDQYELPSGDVEADIARYQAFYSTKAGKKPEHFFGYKK